MRCVVLLALAVAACSPDTERGAGRQRPSLDARVDARPMQWITFCGEEVAVTTHRVSSVTVLLPADAFASVTPMHRSWWTGPLHESEIMVPRK